MLGTLLSVVALVAALALSILTAGSNEVFVALAVVMAALVGASLFGSHAGWFAAAALMGWFAMMIASPFSLTTQQLNGLRRQVRRGDEDAQVLLDFYAVLEPYAFWLMVAMTVFVLGVYVFGLRRSSTGAFRHLLDASDGLAEFCTRVGVAAALLYLPMMIIIVYDVFQRKYLGINPGFTNTQWYSIFTSTKLQEMEWHLHAVLFLLCLGYAYIKDAHVRIELVRETLRPRTRIWIELLGCLFFMVPYCYVVMQYGIENAVRAFNIGESSAAQTGLDHRFIIKGMLPLGFALIALAGLSVALKCFVYLFGPRSLQQASSYHAGADHSPMPVSTSPKQA